MNRYRILEASKLNQSIGCVFHESPTVAESKIIGDRDNKDIQSIRAKYKIPDRVPIPSNRIIIEAILQDVGHDNRNGRLYKAKDLFPAIKAARLVELQETGNLKSELGHPLSVDLKRQKNIDQRNCCNRLIWVYSDGDKVMGIVCGTQNDLGKYFDDEVASGEVPSYSLRSFGNLVTEAGKQVVKNITIITWDRVIYPSHQKAYMTKILKENAGDIEHENYVKINENYGGQIIPYSGVFTESGALMESANMDMRDAAQFAMDESAIVRSLVSQYNIISESAEIVCGGKAIRFKDANQLDTYQVNLESYVYDEMLSYSCNSRKKFHI